MTSATHSPGTLAAAALAYASRGTKVFPLWHAVDGVCTCADGADCGSPGKHPRVPRGVNLATSHVDQVALWWGYWPLANIGVPAAANDLAIIDVDPDKGGDETLATLASWLRERHGVDMMATRTVRTGTGGLHLYYRQPLGGIKTSSKTFGAPGVDTRGRGGYVVAPPSMHYCGKPYEMIMSPYGLAPWPAPLSQIIDAAPTVRRAPAPDGTGPSRPAGGPELSRWAAAGLRAECEALRGMTRPDSGRNNALNVAAYKMGRRVGAGLIDAETVAAALIDAASGWQGHTQREIEATVSSGIDAGKRRPHTGPAARGQS